MLKERIITAFIMIAVLLAALFLLSSHGFAYVLLAIAAVAAWEWADLSSLSSPLERVAYAVVVVAIIAVLADAFNLLNTSFIESLSLSVSYPKYLREVLAAGVLWWGFALLWVLGYPGSAAIWGHKWLRAVMGLFVLVPSVIALLYVNAQDQGQAYFLYLIGIVSSADIGAYFVGRAFGKKKLAPSVSPGKSWAGFWGGAAAVAVFSLIVGLKLDVLGLSYIQLVLVTVVAALASVLGDLLESMVKRQRGIKDSSQLLPGHGGVMDRIDSLSAAAPVFVLLAVLLTDKL